MFEKDKEIDKLLPKDYLYLTTATGDFDLTTATEVSDSVMRAVHRYTPTKLIMNLQNAGRLDSSAMGALIYIRSECLRVNCEVILVGISEQLRATFDLTGLSDFFTIIDTIQEILK